MPLFGAANPLLPAGKARGLAMGTIGGAVLLVEDDDIVRTLLALDLEERGMRVREAADSSEALRILAADPGSIVVLVTDLDLGPGQPNGRALAREVQARWPGIPVLLVTGHERWSDQRRPAGLENLPVLTKPFSLDALECAMRKLTDRWQLPRP